MVVKVFLEVQVVRQFEIGNIIVARSRNEWKSCDFQIILIMSKKCKEFKTP